MHVDETEKIKVRGQEKGAFGFSYSFNRLIQTAYPLPDQASSPIQTTKQAKNCSDRHSSDKGITYA